MVGVRRAASRDECFLESWRPRSSAGCRGAPRRASGDDGRRDDGGGADESSGEERKEHQPRRRETRLHPQQRSPDRQCAPAVLDGRSPRSGSGGKWRRATIVPSSVHDFPASRRLLLSRPASDDICRKSSHNFSPASVTSPFVARAIPTDCVSVVSVSGR